MIPSFGAPWYSANMKRRQERTYKKLHSAYTSEDMSWRILRSQAATTSPDAGRIGELVDEAVDAVPLSSEVREDAAYFLLLNVHQMVTLPLALAGTAPPTDDELSSDVRAILQDADQHVDRTGDDPRISARLVLEAVGRQWSSLNISKIKFWG